MKFTIDETGKRGLLKGERSITIRNIAEAREALLSCLRQVDVLEFDMSEVPEVDLLALQLGCSLKRWAIRNGKEIVAGDPGPAYARAAEEAGSCFHQGCELSENQCFFWKRGLS